MSGARKYRFYYGSPQTEQWEEVTDIIYERHVVNGKVKFGEEENLDIYLGDPVVGLPKQLLVRHASNWDEVQRFWQRAPILFVVD